MKAVVAAFKPGEGPSRGLLRDYEPSDGTYWSTNSIAPNTAHLAPVANLISTITEFCIFHFTNGQWWLYYIDNSDIQAFPCISTGVYGYPNAAACNVALRATRKFLEANHEVSASLFVCWCHLINVPFVGCWQNNILLVSASRCGALQRKNAFDFSKENQLKFGNLLLKFCCCDVGNKEKHEQNRHFAQCRVNWPSWPCCDAECHLPACPPPSWRQLNSTISSDSGGRQCVRNQFTSVLPHLHTKQHCCFSIKKCVRTGWNLIFHGKVKEKSPNH